MIIFDWLKAIFLAGVIMFVIIYLADRWPAWLNPADMPTWWYFTSAILVGLVIASLISIRRTLG